MNSSLKVLMINASPKPDGNTYCALNEMKKVFDANGVETELAHIGNKNIRGCIACGSCSKTGRCVFDDAVNELADKFRDADGLVVGTPVYYAGANATLAAFMQRLFYSTHFDKMMKVGVGVAAARRGGLTSVYDEINKYFGISSMPIVSGQYWNGIHGAAPRQALEDAEGLQIMRSLAENMVFLMKCIALGKEQFGLPEKEKPIKTNFIR